MLSHTQYQVYEVPIVGAFAQCPSNSACCRYSAGGIAWRDWKPLLCTNTGIDTMASSAGTPYSPGIQRCGLTALLPLDGQDSRGGTPHTNSTVISPKTP